MSLFVLIVVTSLRRDFNFNLSNYMPSSDISKSNLNLTVSSIEEYIACNELQIVSSSIDFSILSFP